MKFTPEELEFLNRLTMELDTPSRRTLLADDLGMEHEEYDRVFFGIINKLQTQID